MMKCKRYSSSGSMITTVMPIIIVIIQFQRVESAQHAIAKDGCPETCGNVSIPYPFGIGSNCFLEGFELECNTTSHLPELVVLYSAAVHNISLSLGQARVDNYISSQCYNPSYKNVTYDAYYWNSSGTPFLFNNEKNKFTVIGCDTLGYIQYGNDINLNWVGCLLNCLNQDSIINGSCTGIGCCQTAIPKQTSYYKLEFDANYNNSNVYNFSRCSYAVLMEDNGFVFSSEYITTDKLYKKQMPAVFDWAIGNETCDIAQANRTSYACISDNSLCVNSTNGPGYLCNCSEGYDGNPYLKGGCQDIDECANINPCSYKCHNAPGSYSCSCPAFQRLKKNSATHECEVLVPLIIGTVLVLGFGIGFIVLCIWVAIAEHIKLFEKRKPEKLKKKYFLENQGLLLQQLVDSHEDTTQKLRILRLDELEKATNKFDNALIVGRGGHGEVYKGILSDQRVVAIKRSKIVDKDEIDQFINEVAILSKINHRNVVKLFGCCLETEVPLLVYEFISNGTLFNHLHEKTHCALTWKHRLKIALEAAGAISYLHSSASISILHRDIKSSNILLDDYFTAKVSDFGASKSVEIYQTGITTAVQGTHGYLDPEYYYTSRLTQKSDVYSFGVILAELLTREKAYSTLRMSEGASLVPYFSSAMREDRLFEILDPEVVYEENRAELEAVAKLAEMCLKLKGEDRPTMKEIEVQLEILWRLNKEHKHPRMSLGPDENQLMPFEYIAGTDTRYYTFQQELQSSSNFPR